MLEDSPSTHHHNHLDTPKEAGEEAEAEEEAEETEEADYLPQLDQACSCHTGELLTLTNSWCNVHTAHDPTLVLVVTRWLLVMRPGNSMSCLNVTR
jgi:hypothetical protein